MCNRLIIDRQWVRIPRDPPIHKRGIVSPFFVVFSFLWGIISLLTRETQMDAKQLARRGEELQRCYRREFL